MDKNFNYDDTLINQSNNSDDTTRIDSAATPPPYNSEDFDDYNYGSNPQGTQEYKRSSNKGIIAATAGIAFVGGTATAYGLNTIDLNGDDPNLIAEAVGDGNLDLSEDVAEVANPDLSIDFTIGSDENVKSLGINITVPDLSEIRLTTVTTDNMSFSEAFAAARRAVGPHGVFEWRGGVYGTYYENEWRHMPADYKREFSNHNWFTPIAEMNEGEVYIPGEGSVSVNVEIKNQTIVHETEIHHYESQSPTNIVIESNSAPTAAATTDHCGFNFTIEDVLISTAPNDNLDFNTAFAMARADVGPGGVFEWRGNTYNTFYESEWNILSETSKDSFEGYDWSSEIDKAKSQPYDLTWETMEFDEYGDPLAEIPSDPVTGLPIDELDNYAQEASNIAEVEPVAYEPDASTYYAESYDNDVASNDGYYTAESYDDIEILNENTYQTSDVYVAEVVENDNAAVIEADYGVSEVAYEPTPEVYEAPIVEDYSAYDDCSSSIDNSSVDDFCNDLTSI